MSEDYRIPRFLDEPELFPIWTKGETAFMAIPTVGGFFIFQGKGLLLGLVIGITLLKLFKNFKLAHGAHALKAASYWFLPRRFFIYNLYRALPPSHIREYID